MLSDNKAYNKLITQFLKSKGFKNIKNFYNGEEGIAHLNLKPKIFIQDFDMGVMNGLDVLKEAKKIDDKIEFIFLSGQNSIEIAVEILKYGAFDYIIKDESAQTNLYNRLKKLLTIQALEKENKLSKMGILILASTLAITLASAFIYYYFIYSA
ncbi:response regulator [Bacteroidales bacterium]|nr:response regulator [Bacteroidales bacterium]